jgi:diguanylate cyclase
LIVDVGEWIFREACRKLKAFNDKNNSNVLVSVNISQYQVEDEFFVEKIEKAIKETKVNPRNILIEITEKIQIKDTEKIRKAIEKLKEIEIGCIGLDDFGSGYSSFSNLIRFSIDVVKIDKFFTDRLTNEKYYNITKALVALIKKYDLKIIAEGVETKEQFELLKRIGCDYFQGYYFSKPQSSISKAFNIKNK